MVVISQPLAILVAALTRQVKSAPVKKTVNFFNFDTKSTLKGYKTIIMIKFLTYAILRIRTAYRIHHCRQWIDTSYTEIITTNLKRIDIKYINYRVYFFFCETVYSLGLAIVYVIFISINICNDENRSCQ